MKILASIICAVMLTILSGYAQDTLKIQPLVSTQDHLDEIAVSEIPEIILKKLSSKEYQSWSLERVYEAYKSKTQGQSTDSVYYVLELKKENESIRVWFDEAGNKKDD